MASKIQRNLFGEIGNWNLNVELTFRIGILRNFLSRTWWTSHICEIFWMDLNLEFMNRLMLVV